MIRDYHGASPISEAQDIDDDRAHERIILAVIEEARALLEAENARLREALGFVRARILGAHGCYPLPYAGESSSTQQLSRAMIRIDAALKGDE